MNKRLLNFGLETRLFILIFVVASIISGLISAYVYTQQKRSTEQALADELIRAAQVFSAMLDPNDVVRLSGDDRDFALVQKYGRIAQAVKQTAGLENVYTCLPFSTNECIVGVVNLDHVGMEPGTVYDYGSTEAAEAWAFAFSGQSAASPIHSDDYGEWMSGVVPIRDATGRVVALAGVDFEASHVRSALQHVVHEMIILGGVLVGLWLVTAFVIARRIVRPVTTALGTFGELVGRVADGDLTMEELPVKPGTEIGRLTQAFNQMVVRLRGLMRNVAESSSVVSDAAQRLTQASRQSMDEARHAVDVVGRMANAAAHQAGLAGNVRTTMEELQSAIGQIAAGAGRTAGEMNESVKRLGVMSDDIAQVTNNALQVSERARQAGTDAKHGRDTMRQTVAGMERIREAVYNTAGQLRALEDVSTKIGDITNVISDIAEQTNLLALNAAIEAARAGEHGRGFAVVAEEVRSLAERSASSAQDINELIENTQARTADAVQAMESGLEEVAQGSKAAGEADQALVYILQLVEQATGDMQHISTAAEQMNDNSRQVVATFDDMAAVTEENTAATEEMAASADTVDESIARLATLSHENAAAAEEVMNSVEQLTMSAENVTTSAASLNETARQLQKEMRLFRVASQ